MTATLVLIGLGWQGRHPGGQGAGSQRHQGQRGRVRPLGDRRAPFTDSTSGGIPVGWREADEAESAAALRRAYELGITAPRSMSPDVTCARDIAVLT